MATVNDVPSAESLARYVKKNAPKVKRVQKLEMAQGGMTSIREADYKNHHIVIRTTYQVEVDGKSIMGHMGVANNGKVHYHPIPNIAFDSALDLVKKIVDIFPDDFASGHNTEPPMQMNMGRKGTLSSSKKKRRLAGRKTTRK